MTYRDSDALYLPVRPPQHAAPVSFLRGRGSPGHPGVSGRLRRMIRQLLQLFITFVAWATGLGLVIGSIVLVATVTGPTRGAAPIKVFQQGAGSAMPLVQSALPNSGTAGKHQRYHVLAAFSGRGNGTTAHFRVTASKAWQLRWTYRCSPHAEAGQFMLLRADMAADQSTISTSIDMHAASGHGSAWLTATGQRHYLMVVSACSWHIKVVQAV